MYSVKKSTIKSWSRTLLLTGPTGVGKTPFLLEFFPGAAEVIVADSVQAYRGLDIGSAKPNLKERDLLPHHLIDILEPTQTMSLGIFIEGAPRAAENIRQRGKVPILSGGTVYYLRHWLYGHPETPPIAPEIREKVALWEAEAGYETLLKKLEEVDPLTRQRLHANDRYRVLRALEVWAQTGRPLSAFSPRKNSPREDTDIIILYRDKEDLVSRIWSRTKAMWRAGWPDEVAGLLRTGYTTKDPGLRTLGYLELAQALSLGHDPLEVQETIIQRTVQLAKRQMTFLRSLPNAVWVQPETAALKKVLCNLGFDPHSDRFQNLS